MLFLITAYTETTYLCKGRAEFTTIDTHTMVVNPSRECKDVQKEIDGAVALLVNEYNSDNIGQAKRKLCRLTYKYMTETSFSPSTINEYPFDGDFSMIQ